MRINIELEIRPLQCPKGGEPAPSCQKCKHFGGIEWTETGSELICYFEPSAQAPAGAVVPKDAKCSVYPADRCRWERLGGCLYCQNFAAVVRGVDGKPVVLCRDLAINSAKEESGGGST